MNIMSSNADVNKQALEVTFLKTMTKSYHSKISVSNMLGIYFLFVLLYIRLENLAH